MASVKNENSGVSHDATSGTTLRGDTTMAVAFMKQMHQTCLWCLTAINSDTGKTQTATFSVERADSAFAWIEARNGSCNLYFSTNPIRAEMSKKAKATDIAALAYLHVDIDPSAGEDIDDERTAHLEPSDR